MRKDVSVGEYDAVSGLTHVTQQRGRMLFNMGAGSKRNSAALRAESTDAAPPAVVAIKTADVGPGGGSQEMATGRFTGLSLYPEEAYYLLQSGAIIIYAVQVTDINGGDPLPPTVPLTLSGFASLLLGHRQASMECLATYAFFKQHKLHPRRHVDASGVYHQPHPVQPAHAIQSTDPGVSPFFAFDVWQSTVEIVPSQPAPIGAQDLAAEPETASSRSLPPPGSSSAGSQWTATLGDKPVDPSSPPSAPMDPSAPLATAPAENSVTRTHKPRKIKRLQLVFRVLVCRYEDPPPRPFALAKVIEASRSIGGELMEQTMVPVKLAVVHVDSSVLLFEIGHLDNPI